MKILQVAYGFEGGIGRLLVDYCSRLKEDIDFDFLIGKNQNGLFEKKLIQNGFVVYHIDLGLSDKERYIFWNEFFSEKKYDAIHLHGNADYVCLKAAKQYGIKCRIVHSHNAFDPSQNKSKLYKATRNLYRKVKNKLYVTDKWACGQYAGKVMWGNATFFTMPNAIDCASFRFDDKLRCEIRERLEIPSSAIVLGSVGRLTKQKNYEYLLNVHKYILQINGNVHLLLVGNGELRSELEDLAKELMIQDRVHFVGEQSEIRAYLSAMDIFVLTSMFEGLPVVMIEAQANGLPCIVSDVVTRECDFLHSNRYISLECEYSDWANEILRTVSDGRDNNAEKILIDRGFEINAAVQIVKNKYKEAIKKNA